MNGTGEMTCRDERRRDLVRRSPLNGIDFVEVSVNVLCVHFFDGPPEGVKPENVVIKGGTQITGLVAKKVGAHAAPDVFEPGCLQIELDREGDFSPYTLCFVEAKNGEPTDVPLHILDVRYSCIEIHFRTDCPTELDCAMETPCPAPETVEPVINYLAKDYQSFRQLILDRLSVTMPEWRERHVPDVGIALVELLAYVGDYLSYYQDSVATEQYLMTARQRISVRRHARLVDYIIHEGCNARTFVAIEVSGDVSLDPSNVRFITSWTRDTTYPVALKEDALESVDPASYLAFEPLVADHSAPIRLRIPHNAIAIHTWGNEECCIPRGATSATLVDGWAQSAPAPAVEQSVPKKKPPAKKRALDLHPGDYLLFEELACPTTAVQADVTNTGAPDTDATHRHIVRLTSVTPAIDRVMDVPIVNVEWSLEDALPFTLCVSAVGRAPECELVTVGIARGNLILVDHGTTIRDEPLPAVEPVLEPLACEGEGELSDRLRTAKRYRPTLRNAPLTFAQPLTPGVPVKRLLVQDPRAARPEVTLAATPSGTWLPVADLLDSDRDEPHFVAEIDDDGRAHLRFGDGLLGRAVDPGMEFKATYRVGNGRAGIVGHDSITHIVFGKVSVGDAITRVRNPLPSAGAVDPEPASEVKMFAGSRFRSRLERAITSDDYATLARYTRQPELNPRVQNAASRLQWNGSWYEAKVALDEAGSSDAEHSLTHQVHGLLHRYRRMGHGLRVDGARAVPLALTLGVCIDSRYLRAHVVAALLERFSNRVLPDGSRGFFHPDNLTFGDAVYVSQIIAAAQKIDGVASARVITLQPLFAPATSAWYSVVGREGFLELGPLEIPRLDNDPARPENGLLVIQPEGGR